LELSELKARLQIPSTDTSQDEILQIRLGDAIEYAVGYCRNPFLNVDGALKLPSPVKAGIAILVKSLGQNNNVQSQSLGDMSKSFFENGAMNEAHLYFKPFKKARFI
jgi:hypothetical protein